MGCSHNDYQLLSSEEITCQYGSILKNKLFGFNFHSVLGFNDILVSHLYANPVNCQNSNQNN